MMKVGSMAQKAFVALIGNPNAGKSALFNALTGARQKIANFPGVTVERKAGQLSLENGQRIELIDLPGSYSLEPSSPDEAIARRVLMGEMDVRAGPLVETPIKANADSDADPNDLLDGQTEKLPDSEGRSASFPPDALVVVLDASNLEAHLVFALEVIALGLPTIVALNMSDLAERDGLTIDPHALSEALGVSVIPMVAVRRKGLEELKAAIGTVLSGQGQESHLPAKINTASQKPLSERRVEAGKIARIAIRSESTARQVHSKLDQWLLHPFAGPIILFLLLFVMFQAVFAWAAPFADALDGAAASLSQWVGAHMGEGILRDFLTEGVIAGVGSVLVFLPQIVILFAFILVMEQSGYMARAAFVMDRLMARLGLSGRSFIPLLSSFACAIPGIMATRSIADPKDRLTTILIAPLMTCSARLPVYALIISAVIPARDVGAIGIGLQGLVLFALYLAGIVGAMLVALVLRRTVTKGGSSGFIMELPRYQWPRLRDVLIGLWQRAWIFMRRAGTIIFAATVILWLLLTFPKAGEGESQMDSSIAGHIAGAIQPVFEPIGFNKEMTLSIIPSMAAREVAISSLATTYAIEGDGNGAEDAVDDEEESEEALRSQIAARWSLPTALAFLAWFVFAPQCLSTIAVARRETNGWKWPGFMLFYLFALAYIFAGITFWSASALGL